MTKRRQSGGKPQTKKEPTPAPESEAESLTTESDFTVYQWEPRLSLETLTKPERTSAILLQRKEIRRDGGIKYRPYVQVQHGQRRPSGVGSPPRRFSPLIPIRLKEMKPNDKTSYRGRLIELEIIEAAQTEKGVVLLGQDDDAHAVFVYLRTTRPNQKDPALQEKVGFGSTIVIGHPHLLNMNNREAIRVMDDDCLYINPQKDPWKCRFCLKRDSRVVPCDGCTRIFYCSTACCEHDWKIMNHRVICQKIEKSMKQHGETPSIFFYLPWPFYVILLITITVIYVGFCMDPVLVFRGRG